ncbi:hypothetical protein BHM03_00041370 [Ensete ventricosum]|nr:hypothetical protein BHM03_00041370 [Ensete ventricosum]
MRHENRHDRSSLSSALMTVKEHHIERAELVCYDRGQSSRTDGSSSSPPSSDGRLHEDGRFKSRASLGFCRRNVLWIACSKSHEKLLDRRSKIWIGIRTELFCIRWSTTNSRGFDDMGLSSRARMQNREGPFDGGSRSCCCFFFFFFFCSKIK